MFTALGMQLVVVVPVVPGLPSQEQLALRAGSYVAVAAFLALNVRLRRPSPAAEVIFEPAPAPVVTPPPPAIAGQWPAASPPAVAVLNEALPPLMVKRGRRAAVDRRRGRCRAAGGRGERGATRRSP